MKRGEVHVLADISNALLHRLRAVIQAQDVDSAHSLNSFLNYILASLMSPQIGRNQSDLAPFLTDELLSLESVFLFVGSIDDGGVGTLHGIEDGDCSADTAVTSGDEGLHARELAGRFVELVAAVSGGELVVDRIRTLHFVLFAWGRLVGYRDFMAWRIC